MPKPIKKRTVTKPAAASEQDFNVYIERMQEVSAQRRKQILTIVGTVLAIIILCVGGYWYVQSREARLAELEYQGYSAYTGLYKDPKPPMKERAEQALELFAQARGIKATPYNLYYMASAQAELGQTDAALATLKDLSSVVSGNPYFKTLGLYKEGTILNLAGRQEEALERFDKFVTMKDVPMRDMALLEAARILEKMGRTEDSKNRYEILRLEHPNSKFIDEANYMTGNVEKESELQNALRTTAPMSRNLGTSGDAGEPSIPLQGAQ